MNDLDALLAEVEDTVGNTDSGYDSQSKKSNKSNSSSSSSYDRGGASSTSSSSSSSSSLSSSSYSYSSSSKIGNEWHKENESTYGDSRNTGRSNSYSSRDNSSSGGGAGRSLDPLDDLLSLTEDTINSPPSHKSKITDNSYGNNYYGSYNSSSTRYGSSASTRSSYPVNSMVHAGSSSSSSGSSSNSGSCNAPALLGGSSCTLGSNASKFNKIATNRLLCLKCMCEVVRFADYHWDDDVDYMFFRNYWPEPERLYPKMKSKRGYAAYCCQCCWTSVSDIVSVGNDLKWVQPN
jgi:hypothetical protein